MGNLIPHYIKREELKIVLIDQVVNNQDIMYTHLSIKPMTKVAYPEHLGLGCIYFWGPPKQISPNWHFLFLRGYPFLHADLCRDNRLNMGTNLCRTRWSVYCHLYLSIKLKQCHFQSALFWIEIEPATVLDWAVSLFINLPLYYSGNF